jgi:hypothetical protein
MNNERKLETVNVLFSFYDSLACGFSGADGGETSTRADIGGDETVFGSGGLLLLEDFRAVGFAFRRGVTSASTAAGHSILVSLSLF